MPPGACGIAILRHGLVTEHPHNQASCRDAVDGHLTLLTHCWQRHWLTPFHDSPRSACRAFHRLSQVALTSHQNHREKSKGCGAGTPFLGRFDG